MASVDREFKITYGTFIVGGTSAPGSERLIDGYLRINKSFVNASVEFDFVISATTENAFKTEIDAVEEAFRKPFQDLLIEQGAETILDLSPSTDTGLNTQPEIIKSEDNADTGRSRHYTVRVNCEMPADNAPTVGIRESSVNIAYSPARKRQVTFTGVGTAISGTDARAQYESIISTYCTGILATFGGTYELGEEPLTQMDYEDKTISFTRVYDELIYSEAGSTDDPAIVRQSFAVTRTRLAPGDSPGHNAKRLVEVTANYDCWLDKDVTQNLRGKWDNTIKEWVYLQIQANYSSGTLAVTNVSPRFDYTENRISATVSGLIADTTGVISATMTTAIMDQTGVVLIPAWNSNDSTRLSKYAYMGPAIITRTTTFTRRVFGNASQAAGGAGGGGVINAVGGGNPLANPMGGGIGFNFPGGGSIPAMSNVNPLANPMGGIIQFQFGGGNVNAAGGGGGGGGGASTPTWVLISTQDTDTPLEIGIDDYTFTVTDLQTVTVEQQYKPLVAAGGTTQVMQGGI